MTETEEHLNSLINSSITSGYPVNKLAELFKLYVDEKFKDLEDSLESHIEYGMHVESGLIK